ADRQLPAQHGDREQCAAPSDVRRDRQGRDERRNGKARQGMGRDHQREHPTGSLRGTGSRRRGQAAGSDALNMLTRSADSPCASVTSRSILKMVPSRLTSTTVRPCAPTAVRNAAVWSYSTEL